MITPLPGATPTKPGSATKPFPGVDADVMTRDGKSVEANLGGYLVIKRPWPSMLRTIWGDDDRYKQQYWSQIEGIYFAGDGARRDKDGYFWIMGGDSSAFFTKLFSSNSVVDRQARIAPLSRM